MRLLFVVVVVLHGLIHLLGVVKAFGLAALPQLTQPIAPSMGMVWLTAALLFLATAAAIVVWPRWWWAVGAVAVLVSMPAVLASGSDARAGLVANLLILVGLVFGYLVDGPSSLRAGYDDDVARVLVHQERGAVLTEDDLRGLPATVQRYIRGTGAVGRPRVHHMRARMHGRIRSGANGRWMPFTAEQHNVFDPPARLFYMAATMYRFPLQGLHRYVDGAASMRIEAAGLVPVVDLAGEDMTRAETVTLFNDMCIMAPAALIDPAITWEPAEDRRARAVFRHAGHTIRAELWFNEAGDLVDFWSDDRLVASADGQTLTAMRWSTPIGQYRDFGGHRLASQGEGRWQGADGAYAYIELTIDDVRYGEGGKE